MEPDSTILNREFGFAQLLQITESLNEAIAHITALEGAAPLILGPPSTAVVATPATKNQPWAYTQAQANALVDAVNRLTVRVNQLAAFHGTI